MNFIKISCSGAKWKESHLEDSYSFTVVPVDANNVIIKNWNPENKDKRN